VDSDTRKLRVRWPETIAFLIALVIGLLVWSRADDKITAPVLTTEHRLQLLNDFKSAVIAQNNAVLAQQRAQALVQKFYQTQSELAKADKFPEGTTFTINVDNDEITPIMPKDKSGKDAKK